MTWITKLYETYERSKGSVQIGTGFLPPVSHSIQQAHIEVVIDGLGNFVSASSIGKVETIIPVVIIP
jgi:CRISPR-associated protein Csd1